MLIIYLATAGINFSKKIMLLKKLLDIKAISQQHFSPLEKKCYRRATLRNIFSNRKLNLLLDLNKQSLQNVETIIFSLTSLLKHYSRFR